MSEILKKINISCLRFYIRSNNPIQIIFFKVTDIYKNSA